MLDIPMTEIRLDRSGMMPSIRQSKPGMMPSIRQSKPAGMVKHVGMYAKPT
jgi:hypothetical protein